MATVVVDSGYPVSDAGDMTSTARRIVVSIAAAAAVLAGAPAASADTAQADNSGWHGQRYRQMVALGDSFTAGPGIPDQVGTPAACTRSNHNYPTLVAAALRVTDFTDISCGGATTAHMTTAQQLGDGTSNQPQFTALSRQTDLVVLTIGGNDVGFGEIIGTCLQLAMADPVGNPCQRHYTQNGREVLRDRIAAVAPKVRAVLTGIAERTPHATVVLVGPLRLLPQTGSCFPIMPFAAGDTPYFDGIEAELSATMAQQARAAGARFVDAYALSTGRDGCQPADVKWTEGLRPTSPAAPIHPNARGMAAMADMVLTELRCGRR